MANLQDDPHRRYNQLTGEWVLVSPHRTKRPWQGDTEETAGIEELAHDPSCYLCPGNTRMGGAVNDNYEDTFVFTNDFAALKEDVQGEAGTENNGLFIAETIKGICRVVCFSPNHSLTLAQMEVEQIEKVVKRWQDEFRELGSKEYINYVQIFENRGKMMGCSNPHPHGQIWATSIVPDEPAKESEMQLAYYEKNQCTLLSDYLKQELQAGERVVAKNDDFVALVPFWAVWPFEVMIISREPLQHINQFNEHQTRSFAKILSVVTIKYDNLFQTPFPYSAGLHQAPTDGQAHEEWHFHMHFYPPLLRSTTVKKFMVGFEMLGNPQRDITAEYSAKMLQELPETHYKKI